MEARERMKYMPGSLAGRVRNAAYYQEGTCMNTTSIWSLRTRSLDLGQRTLVMGVLNVTPDSFSDGGEFQSCEAAVAHGLKLLDEGADILDIGAESTRPGTHAGWPNASVSASEEKKRLLPVIEKILQVRPDAVLSVDTYKSETANAVLEAGAEIINDVSGFAWDPKLAHVCAKAGAGVVISHTRGRPDEWRALPFLKGDELLQEVRAGLSESLSLALHAGIAPETIVLDPGYGFGKRFDENYSLLARQMKLLALGRPLLCGLSRKSFLGHTLAPLFNNESAPVEAREIASLAAMTAAILSGATIVRVHAVRTAIEAARIGDAICAAM
jgi:dihydropteroate synthase